MKVRLKFVACYVVVFTVVSTLLMMYTLHHVTSPLTNNAFESAVKFQDIMCNGLPASLKTSAVIANPKLLYRNTSTTKNSPLLITVSLANRPIAKTPDFRNVREVLKSLENGMFVRKENEKNLFKATVERKRLLKSFYRNFSIYNKQDFQQLRQLFPSVQLENRIGGIDDRIEKQLAVSLNTTEPKLILLYYNDYNLNTEALHKSKCNVQNCRFTSNRKDIARADAVIFRYLTSNVMRPAIKPGQLWIISQLESALSIRVISDNAEQVNWTATYRSDSVLNTPYAYFKEFNDVDRLSSDTDINYAEGKTKLAAWFVSNCGARNGRTNYVKHLQRFMRVDIYGLCGPLKCGRSSKNCFDMLKTNYKFYLAFENSNCREYITEKFFTNALQNNVVPIVMGAHPDDYKKVAPPHSYIHVDEFDSPRQLAEYLHILDNNDELYNSYFQWKNVGEFVDTKYICRLCAMVQLAPYFPMWYKDITSWWTDGACALRNASMRWSTWKYNVVLNQKTT